MEKEKSIKFCRVSSKDQQDTGYSLPAQEKFLQDYGERGNLDIVKTFSVSESASVAVARKVFIEMMAYIKKHKISIIVVETTDRLTRNFSDVPIIDNWLMSDENNKVHLAKENCILHKNSKSHEWFMWRVKVATAEYYVKLLSENVKKGQKEKIAQGGYPQKAPIGYRTAGDKGHKMHVIDEKMGPLARKMFELFDTGNYSLKKLVEVMYKEGLRNLYGNRVGKSRMHEYLSNPFYYGKMEWNGIIYPAKHEPLISKDLFESVQQKLKRKIGAPMYRKHLPVFKAKIRCATCGSIITWYPKKGHWYGAHNTGRQCPNRIGTCLRQEKAEEQLFPYFDDLAPKSDKVMKWLEDALKESHQEEIGYNEKRKEEINRAITNADRRMEQAYKDKLDQVAPAPLCEKIIADSIKEKETMMDLLEKLSKERTRYYEAGYALHELALKAKDIYNSPKTSVEDKRLMLSLIFSNLDLNTQEISANYTFGFEFLTKWLPALNKNFEPPKTVDFTHKINKNEAFDPEFAPLLRC